ncbi:arylesterase [uncultured Planktomarina sp.]|uniref:arylesterase n=1 Tax=uncultured Planktomarina sp. TaxID=1538529 RepID=UPI003260B5A5
MVQAGGQSEAPAENPSKTVVAFGDSLTQGYGLPAESGFVPQLDAWLAGQGSQVRMINAGVSGDTTAGGLARLDWTLVEPVDLVIVNLGSNDMLRGLDPGLVNKNLNQILEKLEAQSITTLLVGHLGPLNYGADYKEQYDQAFQELAARYDVEFYPFYFKTLMAPEGVTPDLQNYFQADGLHPNAEGVAAVVADMGPFVLRALDR